MRYYGTEVTATVVAKHNPGCYGDESDKGVHLSINPTYNGNALVAYCRLCGQMQLVSAITKAAIHVQASVA